MGNNNIKITRVYIPHNINADDIVTKTDLWRYSKIVKTKVNYITSLRTKETIWTILGTRNINGWRRRTSVIPIWLHHSHQIEYRKQNQVDSPCLLDLFI